MYRIALPPAPPESPAFASLLGMIGSSSKLTRSAETGPTPASSIHGTIYSGIRRNHAECQFEQALKLSSIGLEPAVSILFHHNADGIRPLPMGPPLPCAGHPNCADRYRVQREI